MKRMYVGLVALLVLTLATPMAGGANAQASIEETSELGSETFIHAVTGCISTDVSAVVDRLGVSTHPGSSTATFTFSITQVRIYSTPDNGPSCQDQIIQDSFFLSDDPTQNYHPGVIIVDASLNSARASGSGSFLDFANFMYRDMAFDIQWQATGPIQESHSRESFEENGVAVILDNISLRRPAAVTGFLKECDNELEGPVDGLCTPEDLASAPNYIRGPSDPEATHIFKNTFRSIAN